MSLEIDKFWETTPLTAMTQSQWEALIGDAIRFSREVCLSYDNYLPLEYAKQVKEKYKK